MFGKGGSRVVHRDLEQAHLTLALEGVPQTDLSLFSLQVFTNTLGGGMSSRLFQEVREKRGLCYSIYTFHAPYTDTGFFGLYTGTDPADAPEMMEVIVDVINDAVETLTEAEIARAKAQMKAGLLMALESCSSRAEQLARHVLAYGRPQTVEELVARIDAVSVESTRNAAHALLSRSRPAVVALGSGRGLDTAVSFAEGLTQVEGEDAPALRRVLTPAGVGVRAWPCFVCQPADRPRLCRAATAFCCARRRCRISCNGRNCANTAAPTSRRGSRSGRRTI